MTKTFAAFCLALAALSPAAAQTAATSAVPAKPVAEKKICRFETPTGSMLATQKTCRGKSDWAALDAANEQHQARMRGGGYSSDRNAIR